MEGEVQGLWFPAAARDEAVRLGLVGWAREIADGRVECLAEGPEDGLEQLVGWCRQDTGWWRVREVDVRWFPATGDFRRFEVRS